MNNLSFSDWVQITTSIAVLIGLGLVIWELQQSREITQAQLISDGYANMTQQSTAFIGEDAALAMAKSCTQPDNLTTEDLVVLHWVYFEILSRTRRSLSIGESTAFYEETWRRWAGVNFRFMFRTEHARWWWRNTNETWEPELVEVGNKVLDELGPANCAEHYSNFRQLK